MQLKRLAAAFLLRHGCQAAGVEVRCAIGRYRADAMGYIDAAPIGAEVNHLKRWAQPQGELFGAVGGRRVRCEPQIVLVECKRSRGDFLRDAEERGRLLAQRERVLRRLAHLQEAIVKVAEPGLRRSGEFLFGDMEQWDFAAARSPGYRRGLAELKRLEERLYGQTKFWSMARYRVADRLYLLAPAGLVTAREVPHGWGLLECPPLWRRYAKQGLVELSETPVRVAVEAPAIGCKAEFRLRSLRNIAVAATRSAVVGAHGSVRSLGASCR